MSKPTEREEIFGRYLLLERIATGGMAEIFRAVAYGEQGFAKRVAIKRMLPALTGQPRFVDMFIDEAKLAASLSHANIVQLHDFGCIDGRLYHAMEYVQGVNVSELIQTVRRLGQPLPIGPACFVAAEVLYGLDHAHRLTDRRGRSRNVVHRDISPGNILLSFDGQVKIADFGIAKATEFHNKTRTGVIKGKFKYMSPEQARGQDLDQRSDLFSLGACLYKMLTLRDLYRGDNDRDLWLQAREGVFRPAGELNPALPADLEAILDTALQADRQKRYATAAEFRDALEGFLFQQQLKMFSSDLARFLGELLGEVIERDRKALAAEAERIARFQPGSGTMDRMRAVDVDDMSTLILDRERPADSSPPDSPAAGGRASTRRLTMPELVRTAPFELPRDEPPAAAAPEPAPPEPAAPPQAGAWDDETDLVDLTRPARPLDQRRTAPVLPAAGSDEGPAEPAPEPPAEPDGED